MRALLILASLATCAARVHAHAADMPGAVTEVNRYLRIVRVASSRRGGGPTECQRRDTVVGGRRATWR